MQKFVILILWFFLLIDASYAELEVGVFHSSNSVCKAKIKGYSNVKVAGDFVDIRSPSGNHPVIFNNCQFVVIDQKRKNLVISGGVVSSVIGCESKGKNCTISFKNEKLSSSGAVAAKVPKSVTTANALEVKVPKKVITKAKGELLIVLDPGHGGQDPGAIGRYGNKEKDVTLRYAKHIASVLKRAGYKVFLTRTGDEYLKLHERIDMAMVNNADFFISIHADSAPNRNARGATIYTLSPQSVKNATLAAENRLNISGNFIDDNGNRDEDLIFNILNLQHSSNLRQSFDFAESLVFKMKGKGVKFTSVPIRPANFAVLKAPLFPAILLEIGYISNIEDEKMLHSKEYMEKIGISLREALDDFLKN